MLRSLAIPLSLLLACGGLWACGRKAAPSLPEGEQLRVQQQGRKERISVYSPYNEEQEQSQETGAQGEVETGVQGVEGGEGSQPVPPQPGAPPAGPQQGGAGGQDLGVGELAPTTGGAATPPAPTARPGTGKAPAPDKGERLRHGLEDLFNTQKNEPPEPDYEPTDRSGTPVSPGSPEEGGF
jgi:hypothetical protein